MPNDVPTSANLPPFALPQSVFILSLGSNILFGQTSDLQQKIDDYLGGPASASSGLFFDVLNKPSPHYQCLSAPATGGVPDWKTVWGPAIFRAKFNPGATNAVFVAHSAALKVYVVAIAGTNPLGFNALLFQDLDVYPSNMVAWRPEEPPATPLKLKWKRTPRPVKTQPAVAEGTSEGRDRLYELQALGCKVSTPVTLKAFLKSVEDTASTLIFTGHSLGGALSPMLALLLYPTPATSGWQDVHILPTAGPTPGNQGLAAIFAAAYPPKPIPAYTPGRTQEGFEPFTHWNMNYANQYDVVPRAWHHLDGLVQRPSHPLRDPWPSYFAGGASLTPFAFAEGCAVAVAALRSRAGYRDQQTAFYAPAVPQVEFQGAWGNWSTTPGPYPPAWSPDTPPSQISNTSDLAKFVLEAHLASYPFAYLGVKAPPATGNLLGLFGAADAPADEEWLVVPDPLPEAGAETEPLLPAL